jgi:hypothetical protein
MRTAVITLVLATAIALPSPASAEEPIGWAQLESPTSPVFQEASRKSRHVGSLRRGRAFPIYEYKEGRGCNKPWARVGPGWVCTQKVTGADAPAGPEQPGPYLPYKYATIFKDAEIHYKPGRRFGTGKMRKHKSTVSVTGEEKRWVKTFPDQWIEKRQVVPRAPAESTLEGVELNAETIYPLALVRRGKIVALPEPGLDKAAVRRLADDQKVPVRRFSRHAIEGFHPENSKWGPKWIRLADGWVPKGAVAIVKPQERPKRVPEGDRWILVDLSEQLAVAYQGDAPVYATIVSTGKTDAKTPIGTWRVGAKHRSARMSGGTGASYHFLADVPWIQYYSGGYAIHGAYWHNGFGWPRSQGCVNMHPRDAQWFFEFTEPKIPRGWHSFHNDRNNPSTWVVVVR